MKNIPHIDGKFLNEFIDKIFRENNRGMCAVNYVFYILSIRETKEAIDNFPPPLAKIVYTEILKYLK